MVSSPVDQPGAAVRTRDKAQEMKQKYLSALQDIVCYCSIGQSKAHGQGQMWIRERGGGTNKEGCERHEMPSTTLDIWNL